VTWDDEADLEDGIMAIPAWKWLLSWTTKFTKYTKN